MIHSFTVNNKHLILDIESGALHEVDEPAFRVIRSMSGVTDATADISNIPPEEFAEIRMEVRRLVEAGQLFTPERAEASRVGMKEREPVIKALCLHIAHDCNLRCAYCFAGQGTYGETEKASRMMTPEVGKKAIDFLIARSGARRHLEVDFFGGEPMLNFETVKEIVKYGRGKEEATGKKFRFTLTTNGTLLTPEQHGYINEVMDNVVLSIDGRPEVHNRMRKNANGSGSYESVLPKLKELADSRGHERYYVRGTYTRHNKDFANDVLHLADAGFTQISVEPVVAAPGAEYAIQPEDVNALCDEYERLALVLLNKKELRFFHFDIDMEGGPCLAKRVTGCGAGTEYLAVTPEGKLFPCHQFVGEESFLLGDLDSGVTGEGITKMFSTCHVFNKPECLKCWAKYYCSGGCAANAYRSNGDIMKPDEAACALQRKRIECALFLKSVL